MVVGHHRVPNGRKRQCLSPGEALQSRCCTWSSTIGEHALRSCTHRALNQTLERPDSRRGWLRLSAVLPLERKRGCLRYRSPGRALNGCSEAVMTGANGSKWYEDLTRWRGPSCSLPAVATIAVSQLVSSRMDCSLDGELSYLHQAHKEQGACITMAIISVWPS